MPKELKLFEIKEIIKQKESGTLNSVIMQNFKITYAELKNVLDKKDSKNFEKGV